MRLKAIILAGGSGERFWPLSTAERPKQFLRVFGGDSLIRQCADRLQGLVADGDVFVVTSQMLVGATRRELPRLPVENVVGEPMRRDTGAAVALGVARAVSQEEDETVLAFLPADQLVQRPEKFRAALKRAAERALRTRRIVTLGIRPTYPATGFGYVNPKTGRFVEKPDSATAGRYLADGYLWNAGMFIATAGVFRRAFADHAPELNAILSLKTFGAAKIRRLYENLPKISFDFAVMEKVPRVEVVKGDFGWDDVGSYAAFDKYFPHDAHGNVREGPCTVVDAEGNICVARSARISLLGVSNLVVVTTPDSVLVADKSKIAEMKKLFRK